MEVSLRHILEPGMGTVQGSSSCIFLSLVCWISFLVFVFRFSLDVQEVSLCRGKVFSSRLVSDAWSAGWS